MAYQCVRQWNTVGGRLRTNSNVQLAREPVVCHVLPLTSHMQAAAKS